MNQQETPPTNSVGLQVVKVIIKSVAKLCVSGQLINSTNRALATEQPRVFSFSAIFRATQWHQVIRQIIRQIIQSVRNFGPKEIIFGIADLLYSKWQSEVERKRLAQTRALKIKKVIIVATFISIVADINQEVFESTSYDVVGKTISALANITYGITVGFAAYGLEGALVGSALGFLLWGGLEVIHHQLI